jgi:hypothetical protein
MREVLVAYPHNPASLEPAYVSAEDIRFVAESARAQLFPHLRTPKIEVGALMARCRKLRVNRVPLAIEWACVSALTDDAGEPAFGETSFDPASPSTLSLALDPEAGGDREDVLRSTAAHELGHAIFDGPSWIKASSNGERRHRSTAHQVADWSEWRANEFMGAFLAPRALLHREMVKHAAQCGAPLVAGPSARDLPVLKGVLGLPMVRQELSSALSERFGLSASFIDTRLRKYGLIQSAR